jgi:serine/threonine-protein kinase
MAHPTQLGKYPITGILGEGAMGVVYKSVDPVIQRPVAIKTIHKKLIGEDPSGTSAAARFRNEAQAVGRLSHPGIVAIYEYGEDEATAYIAMELVQGRTLSEILAANPKLPEADVLSIMGQLLDALDCAHRHGVWHRDVKPANLIVTPGGQLKVTDFGIARIESVALTRVTSTIGTPGYMAPEQYVGEGLDHRIDIFAAGVLLYRLLTGTQPFAGSVESVMYQIINKEPPPPSQVAAERSPFYDAIVAKALAKKAEDRFASAAQFRAALLHRSSSLSDEEAQTTVIAAPVKPGAAPAAPAPTPTHPSTMPTGWDAGTLSQIERALAGFVGPMAKVIVRQAARTCLDFDTLAQSLSQQLSSEKDRRAFETQLSAVKTALTGSGRTVPTAAPATAGSVAPAATAGRTGAHAPGDRPLDEATLAHAREVLVARLGPIAAVMLKKAAAQASGREQLFQLIAAQLDASDREAVLKALRARG